VNVYLFFFFFFFVLHFAFTSPLPLCIAAGTHAIYLFSRESEETLHARCDLAHHPGPCAIAGTAVAAIVRIFMFKIPSSTSCCRSCTEPSALVVGHRVISLSNSAAHGICGRIQMHAFDVHV